MSQCCPRFDPKPWDNKTIVWKQKPFVHDSVACIFYMPINFGKKITKNMSAIESAGALDKECIMLSDHVSAWRAEIYLSVKKDVPGLKMENISGTFLTKVFEGPFKDAGKWSKQMSEYVRSKKKTLKKLYFWYTTCPKCAKEYGQNYSVLFAKI